MPDSSPESEIQTRKLAPQSGQPLSSIYAIAYLHWKREWFDTFEASRAQLLNTLARLQNQMSGNQQNEQEPLKSFLLSDQTVILEDIAAVRPDLLTMFVIYNAGGRLGIGPWYITTDEMLVSGESLIRNLLAAKADAGRYGLKLTPIAYTPESTAHIAQLPQILREFDIDTAFIRHGAADANIPFRWQSPDGSSVLVVNYPMQQSWPKTVPGTLSVAENIQLQKSVRPDGPFIWLFDSAGASRSLLEAIPYVQRQTGMNIVESNLPYYIQALRQDLPDSMRPTLYGELRIPTKKTDTYLFPGTLSSRIPTKQHNARLQALLNYSVEPWFTIAWTHGKLKYAENARALLNYAWRLLMQTQYRNALDGTCSDIVEDENRIRRQRVEDISKQVIRDVMAALPGTFYDSETPPQSTEQTYIVVWNPHNWHVKQPVETTLQIPQGYHPDVLFSPEGEDISFKWVSSRQGGTISFIADAPALGYIAYTLHLSEQPATRHHSIRRTSGTTIGNINGHTLSVENEQLNWTRGEITLQDVLRFFDGGDAGDLYNYSPPDPNVIVEADMTQDIQIESAPYYERLILNHRMRVASSLRPDRGRDRGVKLIELTTSVTFYDNMPGIYFRTTFKNVARDHRLRAHIRTGLHAENVQVDGPFVIQPRPLSIEGDEIVKENRPGREGVSQTQPVQSVVAVEGDQETLSLMVRGLSEYEAIAEDDQTTLALTLVRSVGWLSRDDLRTRQTAVAPPIRTPDAQCQGEMSAEYALVPHNNHDSAALMRTAQEYNAPLQAYQYSKRPIRPSRSYFSVISDMALGDRSDGHGVVVTAFKPTERGIGWIVRMVNPHNHAVEVFLTPFARAEQVHLVTMAETPLGYLEQDANGRVGITVNAHEVVTVRFVF